MRQRKNTTPPNGASRAKYNAAEKRLDVAYRDLGNALRRWRRDTDDEGLKQALANAVDERDEALAKVVDEEVELEEQAAAEAEAGNVPGS